MYNVCAARSLRTSLRRRDFALLRATLRSSHGPPAPAALRGLGPSRATVCQRIFAEFYAMADTLNGERT
jgi:hypothetical protein